MFFTHYVEKSRAQWPALSTLLAEVNEGILTPEEAVISNSRLVNKAQRQLAVINATRFFDDICRYFNHFKIKLFILFGGANNDFLK